MFLFFYPFKTNSSKKQNYYYITQLTYYEVRGMITNSLGVDRKKNIFVVVQLLYKKMGVSTIL